MINLAGITLIIVDQSSTIDDGLPIHATGDSPGYDGTSGSYSTHFRFMIIDVISAFVCTFAKPYKHVNNNIAVI